MTPLQLACPQCRAPLHLMIQALPARVTCPHCRVTFTLNPAPAPAAPGQAPAPSPAAPGARPPSRVLPVTLALGLLVAFVAAGVVLVRYCFNEDAPSARPGDPTPSGVRPAGPAVDPVVEKRRQKVKAAIQRGVDYLRRELRAEPFTSAYGRMGGTDLGAAALAGLTLLECGAPKKDPDVARVASWVRRDGPKLRNTYTLSLAILFLDRLEEPEDKGLIRDLALTLVAGQTTEGGWHYLCPALSAEDRERFLAALQGQGEVPPAAAPKVAMETNSNTQFAVLGLWAARKHKVPVEQALRQADTRFRAQQYPDGSWAYTKRLNVRRDSMTCTGLLALAIGRGLDKAPAGPAQDPAIDKGLRYLAAALKRVAPVPEEEKERRLKEAAELAEAAVRWTSLTPQERKEVAKRNGASIKWRGALVDADARGDLYFLWSVERVAVLYNLKTVGQVDWYAWGADLLLANQQSDGSWRERLPGIPDTCFALLFLARANLIKDLTERLQGSLGLAADLGTRNNPSDRKGP
jgi:hypothetical protein